MQSEYVSRTSEETAQAVSDWLNKYGASVESVFIPWSQSRSKNDVDTFPTRNGTGKRERRSLNWRVTIKRNGREVFSLDYSSGIGHCPAYQQFPPKDFAARRHYEARIVFETEQGFVSSPRFNSWAPDDVKPKLVRDESKPAYVGEAGGPMKRSPIVPGAVNVLACIASDSSVLDSGGFESWAQEYGYDTDSRKAESIYKTVLEQALAMRAAFGEAGLNELRDATRDW